MIRTARHTTSRSNTARCSASVGVSAGGRRLVRAELPNTVAINEIHDLYYPHLCGWTWGYGKALARDNLIVNITSTTSQRRLSDMAGIYTLGIQPGTVIRNHLFHDISANRYGGWGIYLTRAAPASSPRGTCFTHDARRLPSAIRQGEHRPSQYLRAGPRCPGPANAHRAASQFHLRAQHRLLESGKLLDGRWDDIQAIFDDNVYWQAKKAESASTS